MQESAIESTITHKGQTTVPQPIREALRVQAGTKLHWHVMPDGAILVRAKNTPLLSLAGMLKASEGVKVAVQDMQAWR